MGGRGSGVHRACCGARSAGRSSEAPLDVEPALSGTRAGQRQAQDGALPGEPGRVRVLVQAPHERPAVAVLVGRVPEGPLSSPVPDGPDNWGYRFPRRCQWVVSRPATAQYLDASRDRAVVRIARHIPMMPARPRVVQILYSCPACPPSMCGYRPPLDADSPGRGPASGGTRPSLVWDVAAAARSLPEWPRTGPGKEESS
jgi:hypothetical protein